MVHASLCQRKNSHELGRQSIVSEWYQCTCEPSCIQPLRSQSSPKSSFADVEIFTCASRHDCAIVGCCYAQATLSCVALRARTNRDSHALMLLSNSCGSAVSARWTHTTECTTTRSLFGASTNLIYRDMRPTIWPTTHCQT